MAINVTRVGLAAAASLATASVASAEVLLEIDLTVENQLTITATDGLASASASTGDFTGVYFDNFYSAAGASPSTAPTVGTLTTFNNPADGSPSIFRSFNDPGLNLWDFSSGTITVTAGVQAFTGTATWMLTAAAYDAMLLNNPTGDIYFGADDVSDIGSAPVVGQWVIVPAPSTLGLAALGLGAAMRRRR